MSSPVYHVYLHCTITQIWRYLCHRTRYKRIQLIFFTSSKQSTCEFSHLYNPFNSKFSFTPCRLHPASNGNSISESHPEYEGHAHHYVITITSSRGPNGGSSALPHPSSYTAAPRRTAPGHSNLCPSYLTTLITIHSSYGCLVNKKKST